jgi:hypothetical protein
VLRRVLPCFAFVALATATADAQAAEPSDHQYQTWLGAFAHGSLYKSLWFWSDVQLRLYDNFEPTAVLVRPGLSWKAPMPLWLTLGYAWTPSWPRPEGDPKFTDEHLIWQQLLWAPKNDETGVVIMVRPRLEQRWRPGSGDDVGHRFRFFWRGQVPITKDERFIFALWDEWLFFLNDTDWGQRTGLDQNRVFIGIGWQAKPKIARVEVGYFNVWAPRPGPDPVSHILAINTFFGWPAPI